MQLDEQVTEGTKHRSIRVDMRGTYGVMALFEKKYGKKNQAWKNNNSDVLLTGNLICTEYPTWYTTFSVYVVPLN